MNVAWVAGATGFVGRELVSALVARGVATIAHVRPDSGSLERWQARFAAAGATVDTTPWNAVALASALATRGVTHAFCVVGTTRRRARADGTAGDPYEAIDLGLTAMLVDAAVAQARPRFIYLSSLGADPGARSAYLRARGRAEAVVRASGLSYRIARPSFITGAGRDDGRPAERVAAALTDATLAVVGVLGGRATRDRYRSIGPTELAQALVRLAFDDGGDRVVATEALR
ncbi:MAG: NAD(P)H-binding protein [Kofleriaceae bacterium]